MISKNSDSVKPGLSALIGADNIESFVNLHWPRKPIVIHDLAFDAFRKFKQLNSIESLLDSWPTQVQVHLPDVADEASSIDASTTDAKKLFANKMGLLFNNVEKNIPELKEWIATIRADLGLPMMTYGRCICYATPDGKGTAAHFDQNINFVLQLHGTKVWKLAPNRHVAHPTVRHTIGLETDPELAAYALPMPEKMPSDEMIEVVLKPGSLLFVPRGFWHSTEAQGEALALNFTFNQPNWADLLTVALRSRLMLSPEWRELADGVSSHAQLRRAAAEIRFDELLLELVSDLPNWQASDILGATEGK